MKIVSFPSPNFDDRADQPIDMLVLHYTGMRSAHNAISRLCDAEAKVSSHYVVDEDGIIYQLVDEKSRAWHAGVASWRGNSNINQRSIGIEIVNPGHDYGYRPFPKAQMESVMQLSKDICERYCIASWNVIGHSDVAPERKQDPGELFDWKYLAQNGVGQLPEAPLMLTCLIKAPIKWISRLFSGGSYPAMQMGDAGAAVLQMQQKLAQYGYGIAATGTFDAATKAFVIGFQRHFCPSNISGIWDEECHKALESLLKRAPAATTGEPDSRMAASTAR